MSNIINNNLTIIKKNDLVKLMKGILNDKYPLELLNFDQQRILIEKKWDVNKEYNSIRYDNETYEKLLQVLSLFKSSAIEFNFNTTYVASLHLEMEKNEIKNNKNDVHLLFMYLIGLNKNKNAIYFELKDEEKQILKDNDVRYMDYIFNDYDFSMLKKDCILIDNIIERHIDFNIKTQEEKGKEILLENELDQLFILLEGYFDEFSDIHQTEKKVSKVMMGSIYLRNKIPELSKGKCIELLKMYGVSFYALYSKLFEIDEDRVRIYKDLEKYHDIMESMGKEIQNNGYMDLNLNTKNKDKKFFIYQLIIKNLHAIYYITNKYNNVYEFLDMLRQETFALKISNLLYKTGRLDYDNTHINNIGDKLFTNVGFYMAKYIESPHKNFPTPKIAQTIKAFMIEAKNQKPNLRDHFNLTKSIELSDSFLLNFVGIKNPKVMDYIMKKVVEKQDGYEDIKIISFILSNIKDKNNDILKKILEIFKEKQGCALITNDNLYKLYSSKEVFDMYKTMDMKNGDKIIFNRCFIHNLFKNIKNIEDYKVNEYLIENSFNEIKKILNKDLNLSTDLINEMILNFSGFVHLNNIDHHLFNKEIKGYNLRQEYHNKYYSIEEEKIMDIGDESQNEYIFNRNIEKIKLLMENRGFSINKYETSGYALGINHVMNNKILESMNPAEFFRITNEEAFGYVINNEKFNKYMIESIDDVYEILEDCTLNGKNISEKQIYVEKYYSEVLYSDKVNFKYLTDKNKILKIFEYMGKSFEIPHISDKRDTIVKRLGEIIQIAYINNVEINIKFQNMDQSLMMSYQLLENEGNDSIKNYIIRVCGDGLFSIKVTDINFSKVLDFSENLGYSISPDQFTIMLDRFFMIEKSPENFTVFMGLAKGFLNVEQIEALRDEIIKESLLGKEAGLNFLKEGIKRFISEGNMLQNLANTEKYNQINIKKKKI